MASLEITKKRDLARVLYVEHGILDLKELSRSTGVAASTLKKWRWSGKWIEAQKEHSRSLDEALSDVRYVLCKLAKLLKFEAEDNIPKREHFAWLIKQAGAVTRMTESLLTQAPHHSAKNAREALEDVKRLIKSSQQEDPKQTDELLRIITEAQITSAKRLTSQIELFRM